MLQHSPGEGISSQPYVQDPHVQVPARVSGGAAAGGGAWRSAGGTPQVPRYAQSQVPHSQPVGQNLGPPPTPCYYNSQPHPERQIIPDNQGCVAQDGMSVNAGANLGYSVSETHPSTEQIHRTPSGPQENALIHGISTEIHNVAAGVGRQVAGNPELESLTPHAPFDPNLVCPVCRRQFRIGEIQKYRQHVTYCQGT